MSLYSVNIIFIYSQKLIKHFKRENQLNIHKFNEKTIYKIKIIKRISNKTHIFYSFNV